MDHHRRVHAVEGAALEHEDLAAAALLGRRAEHLHRDAEVVGQRSQRHSRAHARGGDDVVAARVPDAGQRVVFGADADHKRAAACRRHKGGGQVAHARLDVEPPVRQQLGTPCGGTLLLEAELGVGVDPVAEIDQLPFDEADHLASGRLGIELHSPVVYSMTATMSPAPTVSPGFTLISVTVPARSAMTLFSIFMASSTHTAWPVSTASPT